MDESELRLAVHPRVAELLNGDESALLLDLTSRTQKQVNVEPRPEFHLEHYELCGVLTTT